jgi:cytosine deaminase
MPQLTSVDLRFIDLSFREAKASLDAGGLPIGSLLARGDHLIASGNN